MNKIIQNQSNRQFLAIIGRFNIDKSVISFRNFCSSSNSSKNDDSNAPKKMPTSNLRRRRNNNFKSRENESDDGTAVLDISNQINQITRYQIPRPSESLILPITSRPIFPGFRQTLFINNPKQYKTLKDLKTPYLCTFHTNCEEDDLNAEGNTLSRDDLSPVGTFCEVLSLFPVTSPSQPDIEKLRKRSKEDNHIIINPTSWRVELEGKRRVQLVDLTTDETPLYGKIEHLKDTYDKRKDDEIKALINEIVNTLKDVMRVSPIQGEQISTAYLRFARTDYGSLCDFAASMSLGSASDLQDVLGEVDVVKRVQLALLLLKKDVKTLKLQKEIIRDVEKKVDENQRKHFLRLQLKIIEEELGVGKDDKNMVIEKCENLLQELLEIGEKKGVVFPEKSLVAIEDELTKLRSLDKESAEYNSTRRYLEWLLHIPWTKLSEEKFDLFKAQEVLEGDHYGLEDVKERILEDIAVGNLKGNISGKILLFVGPPGVGKTSIGKSLAKALGREFYRFSVGGLTEVSEIKGHRRTYVGSLPGKIVQCLKETKTMNPLILVDEIDKIGSGHQGDPGSALLELLDPSQNTSFMDHYLDVPLDVSKVFFVCTANTIGTISRPLLDRMEVIRLSGYDLPEKVKIARDYLVPRAKKDSGLLLPSDSEEAEEKVVDSDKTSEEVKTETQAEETKTKVNVDVNISDSALESISRWYCREAGVRRLQQMVEKIYRKVAYTLVKKASPQEIPALSTSRKAREQIILPESGTFDIEEHQLEQLIGKRVFENERLYEDRVPPGVVMGLAWTSNGGSVLYIETTNVKVSQAAAPSSKDAPKGKPTFTLTGQLGDVIKESMHIALTNAKHLLNKIDIKNTFFDDNNVHLHFPEGAVPKDGPSAGVTAVTALLSLALNFELSSNLAMTGEISLTGKVLPVGGIKEKIIAARRAAVTEVCLPDGNKKDVDDLPDYLKEGLNIVFAKNYSDVYRFAFGKEL